MITNLTLFTAGAHMDMRRWLFSSRILASDSN